MNGIMPTPNFGVMKRLCAVGILALVVMAWVACDGPALTPTGERIDWRPCGPLECGSIQVPADYRNPDAGSIRIAVAVHRATSPDQRIGLSVRQSRRSGWERYSDGLRSYRGRVQR